MRIRPNISVRDGRYWGMALENQGTSPKLSISEQSWRAARKTRAAWRAPTTHPFESMAAERIGRVAPALPGALRHWSQVEATAEGDDHAQGNPPPRDTLEPAG